MRVTFNSGHASSMAAVAETAADMMEAQRQVSSGRRMATSSDDPSSASASVVERSELAATEQYRQATDTVTSRLTVIDTVLSNLVDQMTAAKVAVQSGSGSVPEAQRIAAADHILAIRDSILAAVNTQYRGVYLLSGAESQTPPYDRVGDVISAYQGASSVIRVDIDRQTSVSVAVDCGSLLQGTDPDDVFTVLAGLADAVRAGDADAIATAMPALDATFERVNRAIGKVGADLTLVTTQQAQLDARKMASQTRISALEDVNLAEAITAMNQADTAYRAALGAVGTTSRLSLLDYLT